MLEIKRVHKELTATAKAKVDEVLKVLNLRSPRMFYAIIDGKRICSQAEKEAIAKIYEKPVEDLFKEVPVKKKKKKTTVK